MCGESIIFLGVGGGVKNKNGGKAKKIGGGELVFVVSNLGRQKTGGEGPKIFLPPKFFRTQNLFLEPQFFWTKIFLTKNFLLTKYFFTKNFFRLKFFC